MVHCPVRRCHELGTAALEDLQVGEFAPRTVNTPLPINLVKYVLTCVPVTKTRSLSLSECAYDTLRQQLWLDGHKSRSICRLFYQCLTIISFFLQYLIIRPKSVPVGLVLRQLGPRVYFYGKSRGRYRGLIPENVSDSPSSTSKTRYETPRYKIQFF